MKNTHSFIHSFGPWDMEEWVEEDGDDEENKSS